MGLYLALAVAVAFGGLGAFMAEKRNRSHFIGFSLGFFFGLIGLFTLHLFFPKKED